MSVKQGGKTIAGATQYHPDLFDFKWADHILDDAQWLMANPFSWQYGSMYQAAYANLSAAIAGKTLQSETVFGITIQFYLADDGHKICPASEEDKVLSLYNKIGFAWYYIIDTTNQRFKLPRKSAEFLAKADYIDYAHPIEMTNGGTSSVYGWFYISGHSYSGQETVSLNGQVVYWGGNAGSERLSGDCILWVKPGDVISWATWNGQVAMSRIYPAVKSGISAPNEKYLYFYVGAFTQTSLENIASITTETLNNKMDVGTPLARDIFSPDEWVGGAAENILAAGVGSGTITFTKNWQEYDYLWFSSVSDGSSSYDDSPHWVSVKWLLSRAAAGDTNLAIIRYASGAYWYVNPQTWTETTMPVGGGSENLYINRVYAIKLKNITAENVGYLNYVGNFATVTALNAAAPSAMGQWAIVDADENHSNLQTKYFSTKNVSGQFVWSYGGVINVSLAGADYVVESQEPTAGNNYTWYRKYKSGWVEQGGRSTGLDRTITLPITMSDANYTIITEIIGNIGWEGYSHGVLNITTTGFRCFYDGNQTDPSNWSWQASGIAAS